MAEKGPIEQLWHKDKAWACHPATIGTHHDTSVPAAVALEPDKPLVDGNHQGWQAQRQP